MRTRRKVKWKIEREGDDEDKRVSKWKTKNNKQQKKGIWIKTKNTRNMKESNGRYGTTLVRNRKFFNSKII
jgi:hypothetical protein